MEIMKIKDKNRVYFFQTIKCGHIKVMDTVFFKIT